MQRAEADWRNEEAACLAALEPEVEAHRARKSRGEKHPVRDFLFTYYNFRPAQLLRWSPGIGAHLEGEAARAFLRFPEYTESPLGVALAPDRFPRKRAGAARWILDLLRATRTRPPLIGCDGLHEWAMVYRAEQHRHPAQPLRLPAEELAAFVESRSVCCTHYDAFRFFTPAARPLNTVQPAERDRPRFEQPGCLHANMDLYKWAYKFHPWTGSRILREAFELAQETRELDMRASPYDLEALGYEAVAIETPEGREQYRAEQRAIHERALPIREKLIETYEGLLDWID